MINDAAQAIAVQGEQLRATFEAISNYRVLSTLPFGKIHHWDRYVESVRPRRNVLSALTDLVGIPDISIPLRLLARVHRYDLVLLNGGERADLSYLALAALLPWVDTPHVVVGAHWQQAEGVAYLLQRLLLRMGRRLTAQVQPHSGEEVSIYSATFGIPSDTLHPVPWCTSLIGHDVSPAREQEKADVVLTGGISFRDYGTLLAAVGGLDLRVEIGLPPDCPRDQLDHVKRLARDCPNVTVWNEWSNAQFIRKMAGCRIFALPITPGLKRSTADQTILNAMYFGKIVVATDSIGSRSYIEHGVNGFLVPEGSVVGWMETLRNINSLSDEEYAAIGERAAYDARVRFNDRVMVMRVLEGALESLASFRGAAGSGDAPARPGDAIPASCERDVSGIGVRAAGRTGGTCSAA